MEVLIFSIKILIYYWQTDRLDMMVVYEAPLLTFLFLYCLWLFCRKREKSGTVIFVVLYSLITVIMFADAAYSSYFGKYISVNQIFQLSSLGEIAGDGNVIGAAVNPLCLLTLIDLPVAIWYFRHLRKKNDISWNKKLWNIFIRSSDKKVDQIRNADSDTSEEISEKKGNKKQEKKWQIWLKKRESLVFRLACLAIYITTIICFIYYGWNVTNERYVQKVNHIEFFTYHTNDLIVNIGGKIERRNVDESKIQAEMKEVVPASVGENYRGIAQGKNLILIQIESFNDFVIGAEYNGQEITPNINALLKNDSFYFDRFYSTTGVGNTCDAEFATLNSLYPNEERECYRMYVDNTYDGLPWMLRDAGYSTQAFHGYIKTFWNRNEAYKNQGIEKYYSEELLDMTEESGFGLTDKELFRQSVDILKTKQEPWFAFMITLTNHIPYEMPEGMATLQLEERHQGSTFGRYLQTIRYTDEAIGMLIDYLKDAGLYENTMIVMYGDHQGMNKETFDVRYYMSDYLEKEYDFDEMLKIPLIIHIPGVGEHKVITTVGGEIDTMPTIANLMGLNPKTPYQLGHDLLNTEEGFLAQISYVGKGSYIDGQNDMIFAIGKDGTVDTGRCIHIPDGSVMNLNVSLCQQNSDRALKLLSLSREILDHNLIANYVTH